MTDRQGCRAWRRWQRTASWRRRCGSRRRRCAPSRSRSRRRRRRRRQAPALQAAAEAEAAAAAAAMEAEAARQRKGCSPKKKKRKEVGATPSKSSPPAKAAGGGKDGSAAATPAQQKAPVRRKLIEEPLVRNTAKGMAAARVKIGPVGPPAGHVPETALPVWSDPLECLTKLPDNPVMTLPAVAAPDASDGATPAAAAAKPKNSWAARIAALGEAADATRGSPDGPAAIARSGAISRDLDMDDVAAAEAPPPPLQVQGSTDSSSSSSTASSDGGGAELRGNGEDSRVPSEADGDFSADAALSEAGDAPSEAPPSTAASEREEAVGPRSPSGPTTSGENKGEPTAERVIAKWQKQMKKSGGGKGVKFGSNPNDSLFIESVDIGESDVDLSSIDPADLTSDLRRATQTGKGFQSTRMEEERRLASVRVLAVLQNARSLILNWSVVAGSANSAGFAKVHRSLAQLDSLLLADPHHAQAKMLKKQLVQIVKDDETRARIYAINVLKAQQERGKFDVHMQNKVKPLLGRRCFIPSQVVNMPVSAQAEFLNAGKIEDSSIVEGVILKSAGGGLVWVYIFAERMPFRFWMADAQSWLGDEDKMELGLPITVKKEVQAAEAAVGEEDATRPVGVEGHRAGAAARPQ